MPNPKPRNHLLCTVCKKREKIDGYKFCRPCLSYYQEAAQSADPSKVTRIVKEDIARQEADLAKQEALELNRKTLFDVRDNGGKLYDGERKRITREEE